MRGSGSIAVVVTFWLLAGAGGAEGHTISGSALLADQTDHSGILVTIENPWVPASGAWWVLAALVAVALLAWRARGRPLPATALGATLLLAAGSTLVWALSSAVTQPDGAYQLIDVPDGIYTVTLGRSGYTSRRVAGVVVAGGNATVSTVTLDRLALRVAPAATRLGPGQTQRFRAALDDPATPLTNPLTWSVQALGSAEPGTVTAQGEYTAPATIAESATVRLVAELSQDGASYRDEALIELASTAAPSMTQEQASELVIDQYIQATAYVANPKVVTAVALPELLVAGDEVAPYRAADSVGQGEATQIAANTWFYLLDREPGALFPHSVTYLFVDATTGAITARDEQWFPVINGVVWFNAPLESFYGLNRVYEGDSVNRDLVEGAINLDASGAGSAGEPGIERRDYAVDTLFPFWTDTVSECANPVRVALIIEGVGYANLLAPGSSLSRTNAEGVFRDMLGFDQVTVLSSKGAKGTTLPYQQTVDDLFEGYVKNLRPCDVFVLYFTGHAVDGTFNVENLGRGKDWSMNSDTGQLEYLFALIQARNKYLILDSCTAGAAITQFDTWMTRYSHPLNVKILTATSATKKATGGVFGVSFYNSLLVHNPTTMDEWYTRIVNHTLTFWEGMVGRGDPLYSVFAAPDTDKDGLTDAMEAFVGTDPQVADSDADGTTDGDEMRPVMPTRFYGGSRGLTDPRDFYLQGATDIPRPPMPRQTTLPEGYLGVPYEQAIQLAPNRKHSATLAFAASDPGLPSGLVLDAAKGVVSGNPQQNGVFSFTLTIRDSRGASTRTQMSLTIVDLGLQAGGTIVSTKCSMSNNRDNDLSIGEALLLARGELLYSDLQPYVDEQNLGEQRYVTPPVGLSNQDLVSGATCQGALGPITIDWDGDTFAFDFADTELVVTGKWITLKGSYRAPGGWAINLSPTAIGNVVDNVTVENALVGVAVQGSSNVINVLNQTTASGVTSAIVKIFGADAAFNTIGEGSRIWGASGYGVLITDGAHDNVVAPSHLHYNTLGGVRIENAGPRNRVTGGGVPGNGYYCWINENGGNAVTVIDTPEVYVHGVQTTRNGGHGFSFSGTATTPIYADGSQSESDGGDGWNLSGGASGGVFKQIGATSSGSNGIELNGVSGNHFEQAYANGAGDYGILFTNGATTNTIDLATGTGSSGQVSNNGGGIRFQGAGTTRNAVHSGLFYQNRSAAVLFEDGAAHNWVGGDGGEIIGNTGVAVRFTGAGTEENVLYGMQVGGLGTFLGGPNGAGAEFLAGATRNWITDCFFQDNPSPAVLFDGSDTRENVVSDSDMTYGDTASQAQNVIFDHGAAYNVVSSSMISGASGAQVVLRGGARGNILSGNEIWGTQAAQGTTLAHGVWIDGASRNSIGICSGQYAQNLIYGNQGDGIHISGGSGNRVCSNVVGPGSVQAQINGIVLDGGTRDNVIGGQSPLSAGKSDTDTGVGNILFGHQAGDGLLISGSGTGGNEVFGNVVGFDPLDDMGSLIQMGGIRIVEGAATNLLGRPGAVYPREPSPWANIVAFNGTAGIMLDGATTLWNKMFGNLVRYNGDESAGEQVVLTDGANGTVQPPLLLVNGDDTVTLSSATGDVVELLAWPPKPTSWESIRSTDFGILLYSGSPAAPDFDVTAIPAALRQGFPTDWSQVSVTGAQIRFASGASGLAEPQALYSME
ncbi:MAG: right-handed parallel beta-helix repeat-containing protein [Candidatus Schekmanbacteria bacterium]|nr:right-handed parallel beta-helix repeat-containing protein [Candidatus Schekmanbacteria bacterium]